MVVSDIASAALRLVDWVASGIFGVFLTALSTQVSKSNHFHYNAHLNNGRTTD